jgi:hypothetical protein
MTITYEHHNLSMIPQHHETLIKIADEYGIHDHETNVRMIAVHATRGTKCVIAKDGDEVVGVAMYGPSERFIAWVGENLPIKLKLAKMGIKDVQCASFIYSKKDLLTTGISSRLVYEYCKAMLQSGATHTMLWGYATDELASFSLSRPGNIVLEGMKDPSGRQVGVRDLKVFVDAWEAKNAPIKPKAARKKKGA